MVELIALVALLLVVLFLLSLRLIWYWRYTCRLERLLADARAEIIAIQGGMPQSTYARVIKLKPAADPLDAARKAGF